MSIQLSNHEYIEQTIALKEQLEEGWIVLAERLLNIQSKQMWRGSYDSWGLFLQDMGIPETTASKMIRVYKYFVLEAGVGADEMKRLKLGWTNLSIFLPRIEEGMKPKEIKELFDEVAPLDRTDAMRTYQEMKTGKKMAECKHLHVKHFTACQDCGIRLLDL